MKRLFAAAVGICISVAVWAQGSFTIVRPADGSKVRENIRVMIPKNSLDEPGAYIGVFVNGKFLEATVPPISGNYRIYTLDTKKRKIDDGELKLELVKYVNYQDAPRIVDRSAITVTVGNQANVPVPASGVKLRYNFNPGRQLVYKVFEQVSTSTITGLDNSLGGTPAEIPVEDLSSRIMYAFDNRYGDGSALVRMQRLPDKGKSYAVLLIAGESEPRQVDEMDMAPVYMRVSSTGRPNFGAIPPYFGFNNSGNGGSFVNVFNVWPLPVLPDKAVKPGSTWSAAYVMPSQPNAENLWEANRVTQSFPARGEFVSAEWEMGHPCAKIRNSIAQGTRSLEGIQLEKAGRAFGDDKLSLEETIWFALDTKTIIKRVRTIQIDAKVKVDQQQNSGVGANNGSNAPGGSNGPKTVGPAGMGGDRQHDRLQGPAGAQGPQGVGGQNNGGGGQGIGGGQRGTNRSGGGSKVQYVRQRYQQTFILEQ